MSSNHLSEPSPQPVDLDNPLKTAAHDAEVLLAFAAQSRRSLDQKLIEELIDRRAKVIEHVAAGTSPPPADRAAFWYAYDKLAVAMAPLSALSIRTSMRINSKQRWASLMTLPAGLAFVAIVVFLFSIAFQAMWVAGKDLIEQADKADGQRVEFAKQLRDLNSALQRTEHKLDINYARRRCLNKGLCEGDESPLAEPVKGYKVTAEQKKEIERLDTQRDALKDELDERQIKAGVIRGEQQQLAATGSTPTRLLREWRDGISWLCQVPFFRSMCMADANVAEADVKQARDALKNARTAVDRQVMDDKARRDQCVSLTLLRHAPPEFAESRCRTTQQRALEREADSKATALLRAEEDFQRRTAAEVRIILGNLATYVVPLGMGLLGALAMMMQTLTTQLREHTYLPMPASWAIVRLCLGAIAGVFGGLALSALQSDVLVKALPPLFIPFVFGYGIEILFALLNRIVGTFTDRNLVLKGA